MWLPQAATPSAEIAEKLRTHAPLSSSHWVVNTPRYVTPSRTIVKSLSRRNSQVPLAAPVTLPSGSSVTRTEVRTAGEMTLS